MAPASFGVLAIVDEQEVTVVALDTGAILSTHRIEPGKGYWRNTRRVLNLSKSPDRRWVPLSACGLAAWTWSRPWRQQAAALAGTAVANRTA